MNYDITYLILKNIYILATWNIFYLVLFQYGELLFDYFYSKIIFINKLILSICRK